MRVLIDGVEYIPHYYPRIGTFNSRPVNVSDILWDKNKEHWNIAVSYINVDTQEFVGQDGRRLKISDARW